MASKFRTSHTIPPEFPEVLKDFVREILREQPQNIYAFGADYFRDKAASGAVGGGMNEEELARNGQVTEYVVKDLNVDPRLPFEDNSFDVVTNVVSIDYLTQPLQVCKEVARVLCATRRVGATCLARLAGGKAEYPKTKAGDEPPREPPASGSEASVARFWANQRNFFVLKKVGLVFPST